MTVGLIRFCNYGAILCCLVASLLYFLGSGYGESWARAGVMMIVSLPLLRVVGLAPKYPMARVLIALWALMSAWVFLI